MSDVAILRALRTPIAPRSRGLANLSADRLASHALAAAAAGAPRTPDAVVMGNCTGPGGNLGRLAALGAGFGETCVGWGVDAQCGSGMVAVAQAARHVRESGETAAAGGAESASTAPVRTLDGVPFSRAPFAPEGFPDPDMIEAADDLAARRGIGRARQEAFAVRSHELSLAHAAALEGETAPLRRPGDPASAPIPDDGPRSTSPALLRRFRPVRSAPDASVTPGTAARIADGAAALLLAPAAEAAGPHCVVRGDALTGSDPALPGLGPVRAARRALERAGWTWDDVAVIEIVEAFAAQALAALDELGLADPAGDAVDERVNARGGALALGHPWGASGAVVLVRLVHRLLDAPVGSRGVAMCAIGGGMGAAMLLERAA
ncbi:acetyl-CoA C-acyltransferase [Rothia halotolerans]|uniref:acetyl-CoA C-acyltransferase n=1 Tax=Rothia halotolerans TaxID=405770 RepID=UPI00101E0D95|nr:acetyl-CoA C-acyltransferase [Rothia halotolerans]